MSTNNESNNIREFTFTDCPFFDFGVSREGFAASSAILICNSWNLDSMSSIKISLMNGSGEKDQKTAKSFLYHTSELKKLTPKYNEILDIINKFVINIYNERYQQCYEQVDINVSREDLNSALKKIKSDLEERYINTSVVEFYKENKDVYFVYGAISTENNKLDLFKMRFKNTENGMKIIGFNF